MTNKKPSIAFLLRSFPLPHFASLLLIIGYPAFWLEMYSISPAPGKTSALALSIFLFFLIGSLWIQQNHLARAWRYLKRDFLSQGAMTKVFIITSLLISIFILTISLRAASLPPHLLQEYDALNYHMTIPRQHLIAHSFSHLPWSSTDLLPYPAQFGLAPYWFLTGLPNKIPQFIFVIGFMVVAMRLVTRFRQDNFVTAALMMTAILGTHGFGIQMGTAMMDIVLAYLLVAALDSLLAGYWFLAALELCFYFWSKSFIPFQVILILILLFTLYWLSRSKRFELKWSLGSCDPWLRVAKVKTNLVKFSWAFVAASVFIGGPFVVKSLQVAGTPLFPFFVGKFKIHNQYERNPKAWESIVTSGQQYLESKDEYGKRDGTGFLEHFWLLAVPEKGVNNRFDYPLGLTYLLFLGPFIYFFFKSLQARNFSILGILVVLFWATWWLGSQQSRFLFVPLVLIYVLVLTEIHRPSKILWFVLICALSFNAISVYRAHKNDLFVQDPRMVLSEKDNELIKMNAAHLSAKKTEPISLKYQEVLYARFPVFVDEEHQPYVLWAPQR